MQITEPKKVPETCLAACLRDISALRGSLCFPLSRSSIRRAANSRPYDADRSVCARRGRRLGGPSLASPFGGLTVPRRRWRIQGRCEFKQPRRWRAVAKQARDRQCGKAARVPSAAALGGEGWRSTDSAPIGRGAKTHTLSGSALAGDAPSQLPQRGSQETADRKDAPAVHRFFQTGKASCKAVCVTPPCCGRCAPARRPGSTGSSAAAPPRCGCGGSSPDAAAGSARRGWRGSPPRPTSP